MSALDISEKKFERLTCAQKNKAWRRLQREWDRMRLGQLDRNAGRQNCFWTLQQAVIEGRAVESVTRFIKECA